MTALRAAALHYAANGLPIFPVKPRDKRPFPGTHGLHDASADIEQVRAWWERWPDANIGLNCGLARLVVIDLDGAEGIASWEALAGRLGLSVHTRVVRTGGGGLHLFFTAPTRVTIGNSAGKLGPGIDVRGNGGYVVLPPSVHPNGNRYEWLHE